MSELPARLTALGLRHVANHLDDLVAMAQKRRLGACEMLEHLVDLEEKDRARRSLERRTVRSRIGRFKPIADYDWNCPSRIDRARVEADVQLDFLADHRNVVLVAPQGLGKTMIAQNIAHQAVVAGHSVLFLTAAQMLLDLGGQESARGLDRRLRFYAGISLLIVDEVGYLSFDARNACRATHRVVRQTRFVGPRTICRRGGPDRAPASDPGQRISHPKRRRVADARRDARHLPPREHFELNRRFWSSTLPPFTRKSPEIGQQVSALALGAWMDEVLSRT